MTKKDRITCGTLTVRYLGLHPDVQRPKQMNECDSDVSCVFFFFCVFDCSVAIYLRPLRVISKTEKSPRNTLCHEGHSSCICTRRSTLSIRFLFITKLAALSYNIYRCNIDISKHDDINDYKYNNNEN